VVFDVGDSGGEVSSPGFCGGWFIWMWWWLVFPGGRRRVPRRFHARWGCACRWRSEGGWCPYQWTHSAVATTGGVDVLPRAPVTDQLGLVQRVECLSQSEAERSLPGNPPRRLPRSRPGLPCSGWLGTAPHGRKWCTRPERSAPVCFRCQIAIFRASRARSVHTGRQVVCQPTIRREYTSVTKAT